MLDAFDGNAYTREDLKKVGIYELRELGREIGVPSPTTMKKEQLIDYIVGIIHGDIQKNDKITLRGRPARTSQKSYQKFVDLIDKVEAPKLNNSFVNKKDFDASLAYPETILSKVASYKEDYVSGTSSDQDSLLQKGVVCVDGDKVVVRKLRFVATLSDPIIPENIMKEYGLVDNDIIEYFVDDGSQEVNQIIKINGELASKIDLVNVRKHLSCPDETVAVKNGFSIKSKSSDLIITTSVDKGELVDDIAKSFNNAGYSVCKVCFDRLKNGKEVNTLELTEYFQECVGDEFETMAVMESAVERVKFYSALGFKSVIVIDNLNWLLNVIDSYPASVYGSFIQKLARLTITNMVTVVCVSNPVPEVKLNALTSVFDYILNIDKID